MPLSSMKILRRNVKKQINQNEIDVEIEVNIDVLTGKKSGSGNLTIEGEVKQSSVSKTGSSGEFIIQS